MFGDPRWRDDPRERRDDWRDRDDDGGPFVGRGPSSQNDNLKPTRGVARTIDDATSMQVGAASIRVTCSCEISICRADPIERSSTMLAKAKQFYAGLKRTREVEHDSPVHFGLLRRRRTPPGARRAHRDVEVLTIHNLARVPRPSATALPTPSVNPLTVNQPRTQNS